jgi:hypothetical protein
MADALKSSILAVIVGVCMSGASTLLAQDFDRQARLEENHEDSLYYQQPAYRPNTRAIIHQKALARSEQRQARLASLDWYGISNARPATAATPFTSLHSRAWQTPGLRPYAWHPFAGPTFVYYTR